jgi:hypothetical protein
MRTWSTYIGDERVNARTRVTRYILSIDSGRAGILIIRSIKVAVGVKAAITVIWPETCCKEEMSLLALVSFPRLLQPHRELSSSPLGGSGPWTPYQYVYPRTSENSS